MTQSEQPMASPERGRETGDLECEISRLERAEKELRQAKERAEAVSEAKSLFLADMSHEILTPLAGVIGMADLLLETSLDADQSRFAKAIQSNARRLLGVISDILDFSKIEAGQLTLAPVDFDLSAILHESLEQFELKASEKGLWLERRIAADTPRRIHGDPARLRQILSTLADNAIRFTERGEVRIEIQRLESDANGCVLRFSVQDAGPGIAAERIPELFKPFSQDGASLVRNNAGAGLGLPIAKRLAEMMGGAIGCLSQIGRGSTFWFTARFGLCADAESAPPAAPGGALAAPNRDPSHARILLVEDNETNRAILMAMLEKIGCEAEAALSGADALEALSQRPFDLVLMDVQMPGLDGIETTRAIRRRAAGSVACNVPVVALTAHAMPGDRERCLEAGMNDYLAKPVRIDDLAQTLARHCSGAGASAAAAALAETAPVRETPFAESELLRFMAGDREIACKALHMFASKTPERIAAMRQALDSRDSESLHLLAHAQKSATAYAGALPLSAIARELEAAARALEWDHAATLVEQFEKQYRIAFEAMKESPVWKSEEQT